MTSANGQGHTKLAKQFEYLDSLREGGTVNMFGAAPSLASEFSLEIREARSILRKWMDTFSHEPAAARAALSRVSGEGR